MDFAAKWGARALKSIEFVGEREREREREEGEALEIGIERGRGCGVRKREVTRSYGWIGSTLAMGDITGPDCRPNC